MSPMRAEEYSERTEPLEPFALHVVSYRLGQTYYCTVDNVDPGAVIARSEGLSREAAESGAIARAKERLGRSRRSG